MAEFLLEKAGSQILRPVQNESQEKKLLKKIRESQIGYNSTLQGPFGTRRGKVINLCISCTFLIKLSKAHTQFFFLLHNT